MYVTFYLNNDTNKNQKIPFQINSNNITINNITNSINCYLNTTPYRVICNNQIYYMYNNNN